MTQIRWRITAALLLSAFVVGVSRGEQPPPAAAPKTDCPVLTNISYLNQLFKNLSAPPSPPAAACPCTPGKPCHGCCCSEKKEKAKKPEMRCCPVTGVCCPAKPSTPACVPPPPAPMAQPACMPPASVAIPVPPMGPFPPLPMPVPPCGVYAPEAPPMPDAGTYVVELKVLEARPGEEEKLVAQPKLMVMAGQPASLCCPVAEKSYSLTSAAEPEEMVGEQGVDVSVTPAGPHGRVLLDVTFHQVAQDTKPGKCYVERTNAVRMCKQVKLGKTVKLPCEVPTPGEQVHCRIEATVKEASPDRDVSVYAPPTVMPPCAEPCPCPKPMDAPVCGSVAPVDCCIPAPACCTEPAKKQHFSKMTIRVLKENEKSRLELENGNACVLCEKTVLQLHDCAGIEVAVMGKQVSLTSEFSPLARRHPSALKMKADRVSTAPHGYLILEGHVHVEGATDDEVIDIQGGKVRLKVPEVFQTSVISSPTLIQ